MFAGSMVCAGSKIFVGVSYVRQHIVDLVDISVRDAFIYVFRKYGVCRCELRRGTHCRFRNTLQI